MSQRNHRKFFSHQNLGRQLKCKKAIILELFFFFKYWGHTPVSLYYNIAHYVSDISPSQDFMEKANHRDVDLPRITININRFENYFNRFFLF